MSDEESEKPKSRLFFWLALTLVFLIALMTVPFAKIVLAAKKSGMMGEEVKKEAIAASSKTAAAPILDLATLRATVEKAAENAFQAPEVHSAMKFVKIEAPAASMTKATYSVQDALGKNHQQYVEAVDKDKIRIVVILKSKEWPALETSLSDAADLNGFVYHGPKSTASTGKPDTVVAEIEILRKDNATAKP